MDSQLGLVQSPPPQQPSPQQLQPPPPPPPPVPQQQQHEPQQIPAAAPPQAPGPPPARVKRPRSRIACKRCHDRRVRCDVSTAGVPCSGCVAASLADTCQLLNSRRSRGENGRFSSRNARVQEVSGTSTTAPSPCPDPSLHSHDEAHYHDYPAAIPGSARPHHRHHHQGSLSASTVAEEVAEESVTPEGEGSPEAAASEVDQWFKVVSDDNPSAVDSGRLMYVGESWTLAYVLQWRRRGEMPLVNGNDSSPGALTEEPKDIHVAVPADPAVDSPPSSTPSSNPRALPPASFSTSRSSTLPIRTSSSPNAAKAATSAPTTTAAASAAASSDLPHDIQQSFIDSYFACQHVLYPILSQRSFRAAFEAGSVPRPLLLAVLYASALHAPDAVIHRAGFDGRQACLVALYRRAKTAFHVHGDEGPGSQLACVQAAFLLHNMWLGPNSAFDPYTWLGLAVRMAQNIGMHRSTERSSLKPEDRKLWRRIWWCLYTRDRQIAHALGKPLMLRDEDCDVEPLSMADFEDSDSEEMKHYVIQQAKLAALSGSVIPLFAPGLPNTAQKEEERLSLIRKLRAWREGIPPLLRFPADQQNLKGVPLHALLLEILYNFVFLLLHRARPKKSDGSQSTQHHALAWCEAFAAANVITRIAEAIMMHGTLTDCPLYFTSATFEAMTMHAIRGPEADNQMSLCMIAMRTLSTMYFAAGWIRNMFQKLTDSRGRGAHHPRLPLASSTTTAGEKSSGSGSGGPTPSQTARRHDQEDVMQASPPGEPTSAPSEGFHNGLGGQHPPGFAVAPHQQHHHHIPHPSPLHQHYSHYQHLQQQQRAAFLQQQDAWTASSGGDSGTSTSMSLVPVNQPAFSQAMSGPPPVDVLMDYPMVDHPGFAAGFDPDLAERWQDLLSGDGPFGNPFR